MKKILKLIFISIIFILYINISTSSASAREYTVYNEHGWWGTQLSEIAKTYLGDKSKSQVDINDLRLLLAQRVCNAWAWGCNVDIGLETYQDYVDRKADGLAKWRDWELHIWCWNGLLSYFLFCVEDNTDPTISCIDCS